MNAPSSHLAVPLDGYDTERRPHARKIVRLARMLDAIGFAIVRPDRCVLADGPASNGEAMPRRAFELVAAPASPPAVALPIPSYRIQGAHHAP